MPTERPAVSREFELLAACSAPLPGQAERIGRLWREGVDLEVFVTLVKRHQLAGPAWRALLGAGQDAPGLRELAGVSAGKGLQQAGELLRVARAFASAGIEMVPLKGVVLSWQLYGDPGARHSGDLDLLIRPGALQRAGEILQDLGYAGTVPAEALGLLREHGYECAYRHEGKRVSVDLHWGLEMWEAGRMGELWEHCRPAERGGVELRQLEGEGLLLFLCDHGSRHRWSRMKWLSDVGMLLGSQGRAGWGKLAALAARWDLEGPLGEAALLAHWFYGWEVPGELAGLAGRAERAAREAVAAMGQKQEARWDGLLGKWRKAARLRRRMRWRERMRGWLVEPEDLRRFPLPAGWGWLYYPMRPVFWWWRRRG